MSASIPPFLHDRLASELGRGERVAWLGRPEPVDRAFDFVGDFFIGVVLLPLALWMMIDGTGDVRIDAAGQVSTTGSGVSSPFFIVLGAMFLAAAARMFLAPLLAWWKARRTLYAVTDRRAVLLEATVRHTRIQSFSGDALIGAIRRESSDGIGDLIFEREASRGSKGRTMYRDVGFHKIKDVRFVHDLLPIPSAMQRR